MSKEDSKPNEALVTSADEKLTMPTLEANAGDVIGTSTVDPKVEVKETKPAKQKVTEPITKEEKVALFSVGNKYWYGVGRLSNGYNIVTKAEADQWITDSDVRIATPEEVKNNVFVESEPE
jgi:hypothetical protein